jgi:hypothetical protein
MTRDQKRAVAAGKRLLNDVDMVATDVAFEKVLEQFRGGIRIEQLFKIMGNDSFKNGPGGFSNLGRVLFSRENRVNGVLNGLFFFSPEKKVELPQKGDITIAESPPEGFAQIKIYLGL